MVFTIVSCDFERVKRLEDRSWEEVGVGLVWDSLWGLFTMRWSCVFEASVCGSLLCGGIKMLSSFLQWAPHDESHYEHSSFSSKCINKVCVRKTHNTTIWMIFKWKITFADQRRWPLQRAPGSINHQIRKFTHVGLPITNTVTSKASDSQNWRQFDLSSIFCLHIFSQLGTWCENMIKFSFWGPSSGQDDVKVASMAPFKLSRLKKKPKTF